MPRTYDAYLLQPVPSVRNPREARWVITNDHGYTLPWPDLSFSVGDGSLAKSVAAALNNVASTARRDLQDDIRALLYAAAENHDHDLD